MICAGPQQGQGQNGQSSPWRGGGPFLSCDCGPCPCIAQGAPAWTAAALTSPAAALPPLLAWPLCQFCPASQGWTRKASSTSQMAAASMGLQAGGRWRLRFFKRPLPQCPFGERAWFNRRFRRFKRVPAGRSRQVQ